MYSSKNWMYGIWSWSWSWSWDHCFHTVATVNQNPELSWDQFMLIFDKQDEIGGFPDAINEFYSNWEFLKPSIHGCALNYMMEHSENITIDKLQECYVPICCLTNFWFKNHESDEDGVPEYHNGNYSGWDNNTVSYNGVPYESPDLSKYLILQMEALGKIALSLGDIEESKLWGKKSKNLLNKMIEHFWVKDNYKKLKVK